MAVYFLVRITVHDQEKYKKYFREAGPTLPKSARALVYDRKPKVVEGEWPYTYTVMIEFPSEEEFHIWYSSCAYQAALPNRLEGTESTAILLHGLAP